MKKLGIILIFMWAFTTRAQQTAINSLSAAAAHALPAVVRVLSFVSDSLSQRRPDIPAMRGLPHARSGNGYLAGSASGVIVSAAGDIITNAHVIAGGDSLEVVLPDRSAYHAQLIGTDNAADLALLRISAHNLPFLEPVTAESMLIGDPVIAVGNPMELTSTVTAGILSASYRAIDRDLTISSINSFLQTDAAVNEGMSGSALVDINGRLIGINSAIVSATGSFSGYSFAVPGGLVAKAYRDLRWDGRSHHAALGAGLEDMDHLLTQRLHSATTAGVFVDTVLFAGAAAKAGLMKDDIILKLNRKPVLWAAQLREWIAICDPGQQVTLEIEREGTRLLLNVNLTEGDEQSLSQQKRPNSGMSKAVRGNVKRP